MIISVGSLNPVKLHAVEQAFKTVWPKQQLKLDGIAANSGVKEQPLSDQEMLRGAKARAQQVMALAKADFGVGLEGGLHKIGDDWFGRSWIVVMDRSGRVGVGSSVSCLIPPAMMDLIHQGKDMNQVCEALYGVKDIGKREGYFGLLTNNLITRASGYRDGVIMAL